MFDSLLATLAEKIETQTIFFLVEGLEKRCFKRNKLRWIDFALKHRVLHAYAVVETDLRNVPQTPTPCSRSYTHIVSNQYEHLLRQVGRIEMRVSANVPCQ